MFMLLNDHVQSNILNWGFKAVRYRENISSFIIGTVWYLTIYLLKNVDLPL